MDAAGNFDYAQSFCRNISIRCSGEDCTNFNGRLATVSDGDLNKFLRDKLFMSLSAQPFIGLTCPNNNDQTSCYWTDDTPLGSFQNFESGMFGLGPVVTLVDLDSKWRLGFFKIKTIY